MYTANKQADLKMLRRKLNHLGYSIRTVPKKFSYLGDYAVILNNCGGFIFVGSIDDIQDFLARESA